MEGLKSFMLEISACSKMMRASSNKIIDMVNKIVEELDLLELDGY